MKRSDAARAIVEVLVDACTDERLNAYAADETGNDSLESHRSLVAIRLGQSYRASAWDDAMEIIRKFRAPPRNAWRRVR